MLNSKFLNKIICSNFFDVLPLIADSSVAFIFADLPYGTSAARWDTRVDLEKMWIEFNRIIDHSGVMAFTATYPFGSTLIQSNMDQFLYRWVWDKCAAGNFQLANVQPMRNTEDILIFSKGRAANGAKNVAKYNPIKIDGTAVSSGGSPAHTSLLNSNNMVALRKTYTSRFPTDIIRIKKDTKRIQPTQKPVALLEYLILTYTNEGDIVLDPVAGSCTTAVAAIKTGRNFIAIDSDSAIVDAALNRVAAWDYSTID